MQAALFAFTLFAGAMEATQRREPDVRPVEAGHYAYRDTEMAASIDLRADGSFTYRIEGIGPPVEGEAPLGILYQGRWRDRGDGELVLTNAPTSPPGFERIAAVRDPTVLAALEIVRTDGRVEDSLNVGTSDGKGGDPGGGHANVVSEGRWSLPLTAARPALQLDGKLHPAPVLRQITIWREGDGYQLAKIVVAPGGPNRFTYRYRPSPIEPFRLAAMRSRDDPGVLGVEFGQAGIPMRRTGPAR